MSFLDKLLRRKAGGSALGATVVERVTVIIQVKPDSSTECNVSAAMDDFQTAHPGCFAEPPSLTLAPDVSFLKVQLYCAKNRPAEKTELAEALRAELRRHGVRL